MRIAHTPVSARNMGDVAASTAGGLRRGCIVSSELMDRTKLIELVLTTLVALIGLYLADSYRRQQTLRIAELRLTAYRELWALTEDARPTRVKDVRSTSKAHCLAMKLARSTTR